MDHLCGTSGPFGTVTPRAVIYKVARHTENDVQLSYEHFGTEAAAQKEIEDKYQRQFPKDKMSVVKYVRS